jgi:hypothetical protein
MQDQKVDEEEMYEEGIEQHYVPPSYDYIPLNRFVLLSETDIEDLDSEESTPTVLLPEGYKLKKKNHEVYVIERIAADCEKVKQDDVYGLAIVDNSMVENIKLPQGEYTIIQENYIYGILSEFFE